MGGLVGCEKCHCRRNLVRRSGAHGAHHPPQVLRIRAFRKRECGRGRCVQPPGGVYRSFGAVARDDRVTDR